MKKFIIMVAVILGCVATSFAFSLNGFKNAKNLSTTGIVKKGNLIKGKNYNQIFGATEIIAAVATGTRTANTQYTNTTTDNLWWAFNPNGMDPNYDPIHTYEIFINGVSVASGNSTGGYQDGIIPISVGDVITATFVYESGNPDYFREVYFAWFNYENYICQTITQDYYVTQSLTYTHEKNPNGTSDVVLNFLSYPF